MRTGTAQDRGQGRGHLRQRHDDHCGGAGMSKTQKIEIFDTEIAIQTRNKEDYICITDIDRYKEPGQTDHIIQNWLRNHNTIEFLGIWEQLNNSGFKPLEFDGFKKQTGLNSFTLTPSSGLKRQALFVFFPRRGFYS